MVLLETRSSLAASGIEISISALSLKELIGLADLAEGMDAEGEYPASRNRKLTSLSIKSI